MKRSRLTALVLTVAFSTPVAARAQDLCTVLASSTPSVGASAIIADALPSVGICVNGTLYMLDSLIRTSGKVAILPTTTVQLGGGASFTVSAAFNADPFSNFTFGSVNPFGFGPLNFSASFTTPVVPGSYTSAKSSGTLGITANGGATGQVTNYLTPAYIAGFGNATNLGVDTGTGLCSTMGSLSCDPPAKTNSFAPISPATLTARLRYTHNTLTSGSSTVGWTGGVELLASTVPEPATIALVMSGLLVIGGVGMRRNRAG